MKPGGSQQQADVDAVYPKDEMLDFIHRQMKLNRGNRRMSVGLIWPRKAGKSRMMPLISLPVISGSIIQAWIWSICMRL